MAAEPLSGRTVLITGASRGIGEACARSCAAAGAQLILLGRHVAALTAMIKELRVKAVAVAVDFGQPDTIERLEKMRPRFPDSPDIIINNAGQFFIASVEETKPEEFEQLLRVNLATPFAVTRLYLAEMRRRNAGHVVTIGSVADRHTFPGNSAYSATKFGSRAFHEVLREETRGTGVRATLISPGPVDTDIWDSIDPDNKPGFTPRSKMLRPVDVADAVVWAVTRPLNVNVDELRLSRS